MSSDRDRRDLLSAVGARMGRDTLLFGGSSAAGLFLGLVTAIVLTHFMVRAEYGRLAVMLVVASFLTTAYNLGSLQGVLLVVFSAGDEEGVDDEADAPVADDPRATLTTGLLATAAVALAGTAILAFAAGPLSELITGRRGAAVELVLAGVSGALGAIWRLATNVLRLERRAVPFVAMQLFRPVAVLAVSIPLVSASGTAERALVGLIAGTAAGLVATLLVSARSYAPRLALHMIPRIFRRGAPYIPVSLSFWAVHTVDVYIVSAFTSDARTGEYRLASRFGAVVSYFTSAFFMSWAPVTRSTAWAAAQVQDPSQMRRLLVTYFVASTAWLVLAGALGANLLVSLAPPAYSAAGALVPVVALGWAFYALFIVIYRASEFRRKRSVYVALAVTSAVLFVLSGCALTAALGAVGAALGNVVAFGVVTVILLVVLRARGGVAPIDARRLPTAVALAVACWLVSLTAHGLPDVWHTVAFAAILLAYPLLLVATGVVPRRHLRTVAAALRGELRPRAGAAPMRERLEELEPAQRRLVESAATGRQALSADAAAYSLTDAEAAAAVVAALRRLAGRGESTLDDEAVGHYLLMDGAIAERDAVARTLYSRGVDPHELLRLETVLAQVQRVTRV